jgi:HSP20 family molecular chaperone IbpA
MSLMQHSILPRSRLFDSELWHGMPTTHHPSALDMFDPFDELDQTMSRNLHWLTRPEFMTQPMIPKVPQKYRITVDCAGFSPQSIKTEVRSNNVLVVHGRDEQKGDNENFSIREFKKTYQLPANCEPNKLASFMARNGNLVIEVPLKETQMTPINDLVPRIVDNPDGSKNVNVRMHFPENIDPSKVTVSIKDRDLIMRAEETVKKPDGISTFSFYEVISFVILLYKNIIKTKKLKIPIFFLLENNFAREYSFRKFEVCSKQECS